jgi:CRP/FNR family nitrogen fixation transcriptional regulator
MSFSGQAVHARTSSVLPRFSGISAQLGRGSESGLTDTAGEGLSALDTLGTVCRFARNETIFSQGEDMRSSYKIISGAVRLCRLTADGRRQIAEFRVPGDFVGFEWVGRYALTAEAVREVVAVRYARTRVDHLVEERPDVRERMYGLLRRDLCAAQDHLITLGCQTAKERVASFLLQLAKRSDARDGVTIEMQLGRQDIADYLGLTLETISRTLSDLKRQGAISLPKRRQVVIRSTAKLLAQTAGVN